jgi:hypothetical protein
MSTGPRYYGKYRATVLNNLDPRNQGRIMVQLADIYGLFPSTWALPSFPLAGINAGAVALPAIGSQVWIDFEAGDPEYPVWTGSFWPDPGGFPLLALVGATPATPNIHFQTSTGVSVTLSDNPAQQVMITTPTGCLLSMGVAGIVLSVGGAMSIAITPGGVIINGGALTVI